MLAHHAPITVAEYLAQEAASQIKHEYIDGAVYAMAGGTVAHDRIANNVRAALVTHLGDGPCIPLGPDVRLRISPTIYYYPDALVICDEDLDLAAIEVTTPRLVVEVLSEGTEANDRGDKFANYQTLDSFEEYLLVNSRRRAVERYRRVGHSRWDYQRYSPDEDVTLEMIGLTVSVAAFYRGVRVLG